MSVEGQRDKHFECRESVLRLSTQLDEANHRAGDHQSWAEAATRRCNEQIARNTQLESELSSLRAENEALRREIADRDGIVQGLQEMIAGYTKDDLPSVDLEWTPEEIAEFQKQTALSPSQPTEHLVRAMRKNDLCEAIRFDGKRCHHLALRNGRCNYHKVKVSE